MRTKTAIITTALAVPMLALGGGFAYASTTSGSHPPTARPTVTSTVQPHSQHATQAHHNRYDWRYGDHRCDWRGHGYPRQVTRHASHQYPAYRHAGYRGEDGYQGRNHHGYWGHRSERGGDYGYWGGYAGNRGGGGCCDGW